MELPEVNRKYKVSFNGVDLEFKKIIYRNVYLARKSSNEGVTICVVHVFNTEAEAFEFRKIVESIQSEVLIRMYDVGNITHKEYEWWLLISRPLSSVSIFTWLAKNSSLQVWRLEDNCPIDLSNKVKNMLRNILQGMRAIHDCNFSHGYLKLAIRIEADGNILMIPAIKKGTESLVDDDISDFRSIVHEFITKLSGADLIPPRAVDLFFKFYSLRSLYLKRDDFAYMLYRHPLFYTPLERLIFKDFVYRIRLAASRGYSTSFEFNFGPLDMSGWAKRIPHENDLYLTLEYTSRSTHSKNRAYETASGFVDFSRNWDQHYPGDPKMPRLTAEDNYFRIFPDTCAVAYHALGITPENNFRRPLILELKELEKGKQGSEDLDEHR